MAHPDVKKVGRIGGDRLTERMWVWDSKRRLVGQASQFAAVRQPDGPAPGYPKDVTPAVSR